MMILEQYTACSLKPLAPGKHKIIVKTTVEGPGRGGSVVLNVDGSGVGKTTLQRTVAAAFTASESFDVGAHLGSTVSLDYYERRPFEFSGKINQVKVEIN